jgi:hypothetical protein
MSGSSRAARATEREKRRSDMAKSYYSTVIARPADQVWALVRDFNDYPRYIDGVDESVIEDDKPGDAVGAVRRFRYAGHWIRQRLVAHSDAERFFTYRGLNPFPFPADAGQGGPRAAAIEYEGTLKVTPVIEGDRAFVEWSVAYECGREERAQWDAFLVGAIGQWTASLERAACARR